MIFLIPHMSKRKPVRGYSGRWLGETTYFYVREGEEDGVEIMDTSGRQSVAS